MNQDIKQILQMMLDEAVKEGAEQAEAYACISKSGNIHIQFTRIHDVKIVDDCGLAIRAYKNGALGFAYCTQIEQQQARQIAKIAAGLAKAGTKDEYFKDLPQKADYPQVEGLFCQKLSKLTPDKFVKYAVDIIKGARAIAKDVVLEGNLEVTFYNREFLKNTNGVELEYTTNAILADVLAKLQKTKENIGSGMDYIFARALFEFEAMENPGIVATKKAQRQLDAKKSKTRTTTLLLSPLATLMFVQLLLAKCLDGLQVSYGQSCLAGKLGEQIASSTLCIYDDPLAKWGLRSSPADAEGSPRKRFAIIENGVLKNYIHNSYTAGKMQHENTASAVRMGFRSPVSIGLSNTQISPGEGSFDDLLSKINDGIFVDSFPWAADFLTGTISSMIDFGVEIKNGKLCDPIKSTMMGTNIIDVLKNIKAISSQTRNMAGTIYPYLVIENVKVSSE